MWWFLAVLRSLFHSSLSYTFSCHSSLPTILPSSFTSSSHLFLGLPLGLVVSRFIYNTLLGILCYPMLCDTKMLFLYELMPERQFLPLIGAIYGKFSPAWVMWIVVWVWTKKLKGYEKRHAPYCRLWDRPTLQYFSTLINDNFWKEAIEHKMSVLIFSTTCIWKISHFKKSRARYDQNCILVFMYSTHYSCQILMKIEFSGNICEKYSNIQFH